MPTPPNPVIGKIQTVGDGWVDVAGVIISFKKTPEQIQWFTEKKNAEKIIEASWTKDKAAFFLLTGNTAPSLNLCFVIPGQPVGFTVQRGRNIHKMKEEQQRRVEKYQNYQDVVRKAAIKAGLKLPLKATKDNPMYINTTAYFAAGVHCDPENVRKGISDALFYHSGDCGDKYCGGRFPPPLYDQLNPRVEVEILQNQGGV